MGLVQPYGDTGRILAGPFMADEEARDKNLRRYSPDAVDECFCCGRPLTQKALDRGWWVHLATDGTLYRADAAYEAHSPLDQGWFPAGSSCATRIPLSHRKKGL